MEVVGYKVKLQAWFRRDDRDWIVWCPAIDVRTQARTKRRALESLRQAAELWFESSIERGVLAEALDEVGFLKIPPGDSLPQEENLVAVVTKRSSLKIDKPGNLSFALGKGNGADYIEGMIPAYIAAGQLGNLGRASA